MTGASVFNAYSGLFTVGRSLFDGSGEAPFFDVPLANSSLLRGSFYSIALL